MTTPNSELRAALREAAEKIPGGLADHVCLDISYLGSTGRRKFVAAVSAGQLRAVGPLLSDLDRVEREKEYAEQWAKGLWLERAERAEKAEARCAVLEKALEVCVSILENCEQTVDVRGAQLIAREALSSSPVVGGVGSTDVIPERVNDHCGEQPEPTVEAAAALAPSSEGSQ